VTASGRARGDDGHVAREKTLDLQPFSDLTLRLLNFIGVALLGHAQNKRPHGGTIRKYVRLSSPMKVSGMARHFGL
jgi:hypothetical protein